MSDGDRWAGAYWQWLAQYGRKRIWRSGWDRWALALGGDEFRRRTLVVGPFVIALWQCRGCEECREDEARLLAIIDDEETR